MIGDHINDIKEASRAGVYSVGVNINQDVREEMKAARVNLLIRMLSTDIFEHIVFIKEHYKKQLRLENTGLDAIATEFTRQLQAGIDEENPESLDVLPTFLSNPDGKEEGEYIGLDMGGTNIRVYLVRLMLGQKPEIVQEAREQWTHDVITGSRLQFFNFIVQLISRLKLDPQKIYYLGFTPAQPVRQVNIRKGLLIKWVKGFDVPGVVSHDLGELLQNALNRNGIS